MTIQNHSDLLAESSARLLDRSLDRYGEILRQGGEWGPEHLERVDYAVRHTVVRLLVRNADEEELRDAYGDLRALVPVDLETKIRSWSLRWRAYADLLDARLAILAGRDPKRAQRLAHAPRILQILERSPGRTQVALGKELGLKPANLSRILSILEGHDLIQRRQVGREKQVYLTSTGSEQSRQPEAYAAASEPSRFLDYLRLTG